jgi:hypothetical protein
VTVAGWALPAGAVGAHYFVFAESLCGLWRYYGPRDCYPVDVDHCLLCYRKLSVLNGRVKV